MKPLDLYGATKMLRLMHDQMTAAGTTTETGVDVTDYSGSGIGIAMVEMDASAAAADNVVVTIEKCTAADGTGAATHVTFDTFTGTGSAQELSDVKRVPLTGYGGLGTTYDFLRAKAVITDANNSGTYSVAVVVCLPGAKLEPVNT